MEVIEAQVADRIFGVFDDSCAGSPAFSGVPRGQCLRLALRSRVGGANQKGTGRRGLRPAPIAWL